MSNTPKYFMQKAFDLASKIDSHETTPNPRVGCVIVRDEKIIAQGVHEKYGSSHAEVNAFSKITNDSRLSNKDLTVFITLEPCDHFQGKQTPSCTELLIEAHPRKIFIGSLDPHFRGKNIEKIRRKGIEVEVLNNDFHEQLNPFFEKYIMTKKPYITLKIAQSLNGRIVNKGKGKIREKGDEGRVKVNYITNKSSLKVVHQMRSQYSAILTTTRTILADNPRMNIRFGRSGLRNPDIIIVGKSKLPKNLKIFQIPNQISNPGVGNETSTLTPGLGNLRKILRFNTFQDFLVSEEIKNIDSIMTECGRCLNTYLLENNFVDEINLFMAPKIICGDNLGSFEREVDLKDFELKGATSLEGDVFLKFIRK